MVKYGKKFCSKNGKNWIKGTFLKYDEYFIYKLDK
jgi:hypothetical protein